MVNDPIYIAQIQQAAASWSKLFTADYNGGFYTVPGFAYCQRVVLSDAVYIENLLIIVSSWAKDGPGGVLASAGICMSDSAGHPRVGVMLFDEADLRYLYDTGRFYETIRHELGHNFGIGSRWGGLVSSTYTYTGYYGGVGNSLVGSSGQPLVENSGGSGTIGVHWRESYYDSELMTGYIESSGVPMQLSALTLYSLKDLGYPVDLTKSEPYTIPSGRRRRLRRNKKVEWCEPFPTSNEIVATVPKTRKKRGLESVFIHPLVVSVIKPV